MTEKKNLLNLVNITDKVNIPILKLSNKFLAQISYYHHKIGSVEWSGPLIYSRTGCDDVLDLFIDGKNKSMELTAEEVLLADIGTSSYTAYELNDPEIMGKIMDYQLDGKHLGHIHTHHNMATFFSGVDNEELQENTPNHKMYLSLIVNYKDGGEYRARLCVKASESKTLAEIFKNVTVFSKKKPVELSDLFIQNEVIYYIDLDIKYELDEQSFDRYDRLIKNKTVNSSPNNIYIGRNHYLNDTYSIGNSWQRGNPYQPELFDDAQDAFNLNDSPFMETDDKPPLRIDRPCLIDYIYRVITCDIDIPSEEISLNKFNELLANVEKYKPEELAVVRNNIKDMSEYIIELVWQVDTMTVIDDEEVQEIIQEAANLIKESSYYPITHKLFQNYSNILKSTLLNN